MQLPVDRERFDHAREILDKISYKHWLCVLILRGHNVYLQWRWHGVCSVTGKPAPQQSRLWHVPEDWVNPEELYRLAFLAAKTAEEHELMEFFKVNGKPLFDPHAKVGA